MYVKICGITTLEDALAAARLGADYVGLIRAASARQASLETARQLVPALPATAKPVVLFRDAPLDEVFAALKTTGVRWLQLHGSEPVGYLRELVRRFPDVSIIRAWEVSGSDAADELTEYLQQTADNGVRIDTVILDAPKGRPHPGYECLGEVSRRCQKLAGRIFCAGGLTPGNLAEAVQAGTYAGVDVARGVERSPGIKDHSAMKRFIRLAKTL